MSSTKRGATRVANDFYATPAWCVDRLLDDSGHQIPFDGGDALWLEPCVGDGAIVRAVDAWHDRMGLMPVRWQMVDIAPQYAREGVVTDDYLTACFEERPTAAIMNPPFSFAMEFVEAARQDADIVMCLQRVNWLGSEARQPFWKANMPDIYLLPNRPSFQRNLRGVAMTDSVEYAWYVWGLTGGGHIRMLDLTPAAERK